MDFSLTTEHEKIRNVCRGLASDFATRAAQHDRESSLPLENYEALKRAGLYGLTVPKELGGWGSGVLGWMIAAEELAQGCPSTALTFNMHTVGVGAMLDQPLSSEMQSHLVKLVLRDQKLFAAAFSEPGASSLLTGPTVIPSVQARKTPGGYLLRGRKAFLSMLEACDYVMYVVHPEESQNPLEMYLLIGPHPAPGQRVEDVWDTLGMRGTRSNNLLLEDCFVAEEGFCLKTNNFLDWLMTFSHWAISLGAVYLGVAVGAYRAAHEILTQRVPRGFAQPLSYHPDIRRRVAEMSVDIEAARLLLHHSAWRAETEGLTPSTQASLLRARHFVGEATVRVTRSALTACGAHALFKTSPLEQLFRDGVSAPIMPPSSDACLYGVGMLELGLNPAEMLPPLKVKG